MKLFTMIIEFFNSLFSRKKSYTKSDVELAIVETKEAKAREELSALKKEVAEVKAKDLSDSEVVDYWKKK